MSVRFVYDMYVYVYFCAFILKSATHTVPLTVFAEARLLALVSENDMLTLLQSW